MKYPNMECFIGSGFDIEERVLGGNASWHKKWVCNELHNQQQCDLYDASSIRPRLNRPTVIDDWSFVEGLEGFVWDVESYPRGSSFLCSPPMSSGQTMTTGDLITHKSYSVIMYTSFVGVEKGSGLEEWSRSVDVPILEVS